MAATIIMPISWSEAGIYKSISIKAIDIMRVEQLNECSKLTTWDHESLYCPYPATIAMSIIDHYKPAGSPSCELVVPVQPRKRLHWLRTVWAYMVSPEPSLITPAPAPKFSIEDVPMLELLNNMMHRVDEESDRLAVDSYIEMVNRHDMLNSCRCGNAEFAQMQIDTVVG